MSSKSNQAQQTAQQATQIMGTTFPTVTPTAQTPIGLPVGYDYSAYQGPFGYVNTSVGPTSPYKSFYLPGNQYAPASFASADDRADLQSKLIAAGLITKYIPGQWDEGSAAALEYVMGLANQAGVDYSTMLQRIIDAGGMTKVPTGGGGSGPPPLTDEDVRTIANKTAQTVIGRNLNGDELNTFMPVFRSLYGHGTSIQAAGETAIREQAAPVEAGGYGIGNAMQAIDQMLNAGSSKIATRMK